MAKVKRNLDIDTKKLAEEYKLTQDKVIEKINGYIDEEEEIAEGEFEDLDHLKTLVMRSFKLDHKGDKVSKSLPIKFSPLGIKEAYNYAESRIEKLKDLFDIDPKKAMTVGIADAICDSEGNIIFNEEKTFNKGPYPENRYSYTAVFLMKFLEYEGLEEDVDIFRCLSMQIYEDEELEIYNSLEEDKWYTGKVLLDKFDAGELNLTGKFSSVADIKEADPEKYELANLKTKKGLLFEKDSCLNEHYLELSKLKKFWETFQKSGYMPIERWAVVAGDIIKVSDNLTVYNVIDKSVEDDENSWLTAFDNRANKSISVGSKSRALFFGSVRVDKSRKQNTMDVFSIKIVPKEKGGFYYPAKIRPTSIEKDDGEEIDVNKMFEKKTNNEKESATKKSTTKKPTTKKTSAKKPATKKKPEPKVAGKETERYNMEEKCSECGKLSWIEDDTGLCQKCTEKEEEIDESEEAENEELENLKEKVIAIIYKFGGRVSREELLNKSKLEETDLDLAIDNLSDVLTVEEDDEGNLVYVL